MYKRIGLFVAMSMLFAGAAMATPTPPKALVNMEHHGAQIKKTFRAAAGLTGYLVAIPHYGDTVIYGLRGYMVTGSLVAPDGKNLSQSYLQRFVPPPDYAKAAKDVQKTGLLFSVGLASAPAVWIFEDPNCIFCDKLNNQLLPLAANGKIRLNVALVAFLKPSSMGRATAILAAKNRAAALRENVAKFNSKHEEGGYPAQPRPDARLAARVAGNTALMYAAGFRGTPGILFETHAGKWVGVDGMPTPAGIAAMLAQAMPARGVR